MTKSSSRDALDPAKLESAIEEHFQARTSQEVVARADELIPESTACERTDQSLAVKAAEASWLLMLSHDGQSSMQAIVFAANVIRELTDLNESISQSMLDPNSPGLISYQQRRMLVSKPRMTASVLQRLVDSDRFKEMERTLSAWANASQSPAKEQLTEVSDTFARLAPILQENTL